MTTIESELLSILLGRIDALFEPVSPFSYPSGDQCRWQSRMAYNAGQGFRWRNPGEDSAQKKAFCRAAQGLMKSGLVKQIGKNIDFTATGLTLARELAGHVQLEDCLCGLDFFLGLLKTGHEWRDGDLYRGCVSEASLVGFDPMPPGEIGKTRLPNSALWVIPALIPLAVDGLIDHDYQPHFELPLYRLTAKGRELAAERRDTGKANAAAWLKLAGRVRRHNEPDVYITAWLAEHDRFKNAEPLQACRVTHHLSASIWPEKIGGKTGIKHDAQQDE